MGLGAVLALEHVARGIWYSWIGRYPAQRLMTARTDRTPKTITLHSPTPFKCEVYSRA